MLLENGKKTETILSRQDYEEWTLTITRVDNGYVLKGKADFGAPMAVVIEEDEIDELKAGLVLLWQIMEYFKFGGSKHDPERLRVVREKNKEYPKKSSEK